MVTNLAIMCHKRSVFVHQELTLANNSHAEKGSSNCREYQLRQRFSRPQRRVLLVVCG
jgi:hypothetical protein